MSVVGVMMIKDEADIIEATLRRMATQLDHVIVADNLSSDMTRFILDQLARELGNITIQADDEIAYMQSQKMTTLAQQAQAMGATWVIPFDADEVWCVGGKRLADVLPEIPEWCAVINATLYDHVATRMDEPSDPDPVRRLGWRRREPLRLPKIACRPLPGLVIEQGNHGARYPGPIQVYEELEIIVHHYPYRSVEQMARKAYNGSRAYIAAGDRLPPNAGQHWRDYGRFLDDKGIDAIKEIFTTWFYTDDPFATLTYDPCPI